MDNTKQSESYEPAFPCFERIPDDESGIEHYGMSLREYFAAKALVALITEPPWGENHALVSVLGADFRGSSADRYAYASYVLADAMLRARSKT